MKYVKYSKYVADPFDGLSAEDLLQRLGDYLLESGFNQDAYGFYEMDRAQTMEELHQELLKALRDQGLIPKELLDQLLRRAENYQNSSLRELIDKLLERLSEEGYITIDQPPQGRKELPEGGPAQTDESRQGKVKFELTDKALDFLGFKTLKDLLASLGKSSFGRHDTRELATGIESHGASRRYEFGDTLNLDVNATLLSAVQRHGLKVPLELDYADLQVRQCEYQSSCATVLMLDCSHSMILYGEDRFTPAKKVALARGHLIRMQYPGDSLKIVLLHDSAQELPLAKLARTQVGPYQTNTAEGRRIARRLR